LVDNATRKVSQPRLTIPRMTVLLDCPWCEDEVAFSVDLAEDELICTACNNRMDLAPDPATTFELLYGTQRAA
jgi:hypothetical protein